MATFDPRGNTVPDAARRTPNPARHFTIGLPSQRALASALPRAKIVEFERAGHFLYLDEPARFTRTVTEFLRTPAR